MSAFDDLVDQVLSPDQVPSRELVMAAAGEVAVLKAKIGMKDELLNSLRIRVKELELENLHIFLDRANRRCHCGHLYSEHSRYCDHDECTKCPGSEPCSEFKDAAQKEPK